MELTKRQLTAALQKMARLSSEFSKVQSLVVEHSIEVYGYAPHDIDNDEFIDACTGSCGESQGMTADEFDKSMKDALELMGL
ncbi:MAG: hypothetical protein CMN80_03070 [Spongiibacter sp.]|uniref:hypothetical protein n=1 Tax=Spongiibacter sp. TaxID=2024860 RepID=UPI000C09B679|nr:hypothetical protein [Spongiibacter sp.]MAK43121.1 hypothetical protein [Spongiibacter sp.]|tara:strand:+ start:268 stop:513 length:246 start_codon:yes stop_codon:yes gene_type:complete